MSRRKNLLQLRDFVSLIEQPEIEKKVTRTRVCFVFAHRTANLMRERTHAKDAVARTFKSPIGKNDYLCGVD